MHSALQCSAEVSAGVAAALTVCPLFARQAHKGVPAGCLGAKAPRHCIQLLNVCLRQE